MDFSVWCPFCAGHVSKCVSWLAMPPFFLAYDLGSLMLSNVLES